LLRRGRIEGNLHVLPKRFEARSLASAAHGVQYHDGGVSINAGIGRVNNVYALVMTEKRLRGGTGDLLEVDGQQVVIVESGHVGCGTVGRTGNQSRGRRGRSTRRKDAGDPAILQGFEAGSE